MMSGDDVLTMPVARRIEVFTGAGRRRRWSAEAKARIVAESYVTSVGEAAERHALRATQLFTWRRDARRGGGDGVTFTPVVVDRAADGGRADDGGLIEVQLGSARLRIGRGADIGMTMAVIGALRGRR
ncbi:MAG: transposase [Solirubrobacteraceae bacterium]